MDEIVKTITGVLHKRGNCRLIDKEYYYIGDPKVENSGDVYLINDRYIRYSTGRLVFNHSINSYQLKNDKLIEGIISMERTNFKFGYFNESFENAILIDEEKSHHICINETIINRNFREELSTGIFYHISLKRAYNFLEIKSVKKDVKESYPYDSNGHMDRFINNYNNNYNPVINKTIEKYSNVLKGLSFGIEFETVKGSIPKERLNNLPLIPLRDGSIKGLEYVTIPLSGAKGVKALIDSVKELGKRTIYDNDCSLHLHIGNVPRTKEFILAFYKFISYYQEDIFSMFPLYKKYNFGVKRKNYSKPFPLNEVNFKMDPSIDIKDEKSVNKNFSILFKHLSSGVSFEEYNYDLDNVKLHPSDPNGNQKWNINTRYYAHNLIPLIFGNKKTIEFRIHTPTYDIDKILNFLFINSHIVNYCINNQDEILRNSNFFSNKYQKGLLGFISSYLLNERIDNSIKENLIEYHSNYINNRLEVTYSNNCLGDIIGNESSIYCGKYVDWNENNVNTFKRYNNITYVTNNGLNLPIDDDGSIQMPEYDYHDDTDEEDILDKAEQSLDLDYIKKVKKHMDAYISSTGKIGFFGDYKTKIE